MILLFGHCILNVKRIHLHMTPGLHNPYANGVMKDKMRPNRPWDASDNSSKNVMSASSSRTASSTSNNFQQNNDPFDCDIDWDAASRLVDAVESETQVTSRGTSIQPIEKAPATNTERHYEPCQHAQQNNSSQSNVPVKKQLSHPSSSSCTTLGKEIVNQYSTNQVHQKKNSLSATNCSERCQPSPKTKQPTKQPQTTAMKFKQALNKQPDSVDPSNQPTSKWQKLCGRDTLTMLRPDSWKQTSASNNFQNPPLRTHDGASSSVIKAPSTASTECHVQDPRQMSLPPQLRFDPKSTAPIEDSYRSTLVSNAALSSPLLNGWKLFPHQRKAILCGILMRRMILALDMGLGKTLIGCVWAKAFVRTMDQTKVVVVCPVSLKKEWKRTAEEATGLSVSDGDSEDDFVKNDVIIVSWAKVPATLKASKFVVVADEAHTMQSMQAARTKNALQLMESSCCVGVLLLTGTPMKNGKPSNLFPLLKAVRHPLGRNQRLYETHFCAGKEIRLGNGPIVWTASGSSNVSQLRELSQSHLLYLSKETCLKDLPPQTRIVKKVPISSRMQAQHDRALNELAKVYKTSCDSMSSVGNDAVLGATQKLRMVSSLAKIDAAIELAVAVLNQEAAIVIFTTFVEVAKTVHKKLMESGWNSELLTGETPAKKRQNMVDNFQKGLSPVFVSTFGAGGVGLTLTAACTVVLVDRPWTPGEANQAEDRVRRIGQTRPVKSIWISAFDMDEKIDALLDSKSQTANEVLTGNASQSTYQQGSIIPLILRAVLGPNF